jgi:hypothetical protein
VTKSRTPSVHQAWAHLRFSVVGHLLASPPPRGELSAELEKLANRSWRDPVTDEPARFGVSTIERWYYQALRERHDPVSVLRKKVRRDAGRQAAMADPVRQVLLAQYAAHKGWSVQLHYDNLIALAKVRPEVVVPSYLPTARTSTRSRRDSSCRSRPSASTSLFCSGKDQDQGLANQLITPPRVAAVPANDTSPVVRRERLGGVLSYYHRRAA